MSEPVGEFSLQHTGSEYSQSADGNVVNSTNWEGTGTGYGVVFGTLRFENPLEEMGASSGSCSWVGQGFLEDSTTVGGVGEGTWEQVEGQSKWTISLEITVSNGDRIHTKGEIDLEARAYTGKIYEAG